MLLPHPFLMSISQTGHRKRLQRTFASLMGVSLLAGCEAKSQHKPELVQVAPIPTAQAKPEKLTLEGCTAITDQEKMIDCFEKLGKQQSIDRKQRDKMPSIRHSKAGRVSQKTLQHG